MHSAINRETAKHLGEALSIAPFLRIEKKRRICTLHASDWIYRAAMSGTSDVSTSIDLPPISAPAFRITTTRQCRDTSGIEFLFFPLRSHETSENKL